MLRICSSCISGFVCVRGGRFIMILIIFFCVLVSGCMYVLAEFSVPHTVMVPMRCG